MDYINKLKKHWLNFTRRQVDLNMNIQKKAAYPLEGQIHKEIKGEIPCWADMGRIKVP